MRHWPFLALILLLGSGFSRPSDHGASHFVSFDPGIEEVLRKIYHLELDQAMSLLSRRSDRATNHACLFAEDLAGFWRYFSKGSSEDLASFRKQQTVRMQILERSQLTESWKWFLQCELLLRGALADIQTDEKLAAFFKIRKAIRLLEANRDRHPDFLPAQKNLGILKALAGTIPEDLEWFAALAGIRGTIGEGADILNRFLRNPESGDYPYLRLEATAARAFIQSYLELKPAEAYRYWQKERPQGSPTLLEKWVSLRLATRAFHPDKDHLLKDISDRDRANLPHLALLQGMSKLLDLDASAERDFAFYLSHYQGCSYKREAWQKLSWCALLRGDERAFRSCNNKILGEGCVKTDEDRQAYKDALNGEVPDLVLLKARLLFDGGHYARAEHLLGKSLAGYYRDPGLRVEAAYRMGRICQVQDRRPEAISYFKDVLQFDPAEKSHLSAQSMLNLGLICESQGACLEATKWFEKTLRSRPDRYQRSVHQKAKTGLSRLGGGCKE